MRTGKMKNSDGLYEDFEGLVGSYYKSLLPLKDSPIKEDLDDFETINRALQRICERHEIQQPEYCLKSPRTVEEWANPKEFTGEGLYKSMSAFVHFGLPSEENDDKDLYQIGQTLAFIISRHGVASVEFRERLDGKAQAMRVVGWNSPFCYKTLNELLPKKKKEEQKPKIILPD